MKAMSVWNYYSILHFVSNRSKYKGIVYYKLSVVHCYR